MELVNGSLRFLLSMQIGGGTFRIAVSESYVRDVDWLVLSNITKYSFPLVDFGPIFGRRTELRPQINDSLSSIYLDASMDICYRNNAIISIHGISFFFHFGMGRVLLMLYSLRTIVLALRPNGARTRFHRFSSDWNVPCSKQDLQKIGSAASLCSL